jgi:hypothetical protein
MDYGQNPDAEADAMEMQPVKEALEAAFEMMKAIMERLEALEKLVVDDLIGGLSGEAERRGREKLGGMLRNDFPGVGKYSDFYKSTYGKDSFDDILDQAWPSIKEAGFDEGKAKEIFAALSGDLDGKLGKFIRGPEAEAAAPIVIEETQEEGIPDDLKDVSPSAQKIVMRLRAAKKGA